MKKRIFCLLLAVGFVFGAALTAHANSYSGADNWNVTFNGSALKSNFTSADMNDAIGEIQPGDDITFKIELKNAYSSPMSWWMTNTVIESFEDNSVANGGAYAYTLTYVGADGNSNVLYDSETVGGEDTTAGEGLHEATGALQNFFRLGVLGAGQSGTIILRISLDGETQGNDYQDTLADLQMNFAVEAASVNQNDPGSGDVVKTGDSISIVPFLIIAGVSGVAILIIAVYRLRKSRKDK